MIIEVPKRNEYGQYVETILVDTCEKHPLYDEQQDIAKIWQRAIECPLGDNIEEDIKGLTLR